MFIVLRPFVVPEVDKRFKNRGKMVFFNAAVTEEEISLVETTIKIKNS